MEKQFLTINEAATWATKYRSRQTSPHNIAYLINYARIHTFDENGNPRTASNGHTRISLSELKQYYDNNSMEKQWKEVLGNHIEWELSFDKVTEAESTKHVHRLHPYKGKFIPQLVAYFLDEHLNKLKKEVYFQKGDVVLDPFAGSGTTLVQCLELGLHSIGIDISEFNCLISRVKTQEYDIDQTAKILRKAAKMTSDFTKSRLSGDLENNVDRKISTFNKTFYPNPQFKFMLGRLRGYKELIGKETKEIPKTDTENKIKKVLDALHKHEEEKSAIEQEVANFTKVLGIPLEFKITPKNISFAEDEFSSEFAKQVLNLLNKQIPKQSQASLFSIDDDLVNSIFLLKMVYRKAKAGDATIPRPNKNARHQDTRIDENNSLSNNSILQSNNSQRPRNFNGASIQSLLLYQTLQDL